MEGSDLREQANTIDVSEKDPLVRISRKQDVIIFCLADLVDKTKTTCERVEKLEEREKALKNKIIGGGAIVTTIGAGIVWLLDKVFK